MSLALIAALPFLGALTPAITQRFGRGIATLTVALFTAAALALILQQLPAILAGDTLTTRLDWLPSLGLNANFRLDGLGLLFALLILGIGLLIQAYACYYLDPSEPFARFLTYLMLFQGAMLGIVLSDNILLLLVFWELTSLSSFLLIGFWSHLPQARQGARMALITTGTGGLAMIAGMMILGHIVGSYDLSDILTQKAAIQDQPALPARADPDPAGGFHQIRAVSVSFLAAACDGRPHPGFGLPALGHHGESRAVPAGPTLAGAVRHAGMVLDRHQRGPDHHGLRRQSGAVQRRSEGDPGLFHCQPSGPDHLPSGPWHQSRCNGCDLPHHLPCHIQSRPVHAGRHRGSRHPYP